MPFAFYVADVGSGLGVFVEGPGFALVYDAGSDDDSKTAEHPNRFLDFLRTVSPHLKRIDHVILSHPHQDHADLLADVVAGYEIGDIWDPGISSDLCAYNAFILAVESSWPPSTVAQPRPTIRPPTLWGGTTSPSPIPAGTRAPWSSRRPICARRSRWHMVPR